jgi:hypothetical protein
MIHSSLLHQISFSKPRFWLTAIEETSSGRGSIQVISAANCVESAHNFSTQGKDLGRQAAAVKGL